MQVSDLSKLLEAALSNAEHRITLTVTDAPAEEWRLRRLLDGAVMAARRYRTPLAEIQICTSRFPSLAERFDHAPITESGDPQILRLIYDPTPSSS